MGTSARLATSVGMGWPSDRGRCQTSTSCDLGMRRGLTVRLCVVTGRKIFRKRFQTEETRWGGDYDQWLGKEPTRCSRYGRDRVLRVPAGKRDLVRKVTLLYESIPVST
mmetsp:Transcript_22567/g.51695  ORF Transcript_22567/g.51695 Transcript_22567/m.51695 type:complete len:109 (-) Transcript_22567:147-473(-)